MTCPNVKPGAARPEPGLPGESAWLPRPGSNSAETLPMELWLIVDIRSVEQELLWVAGRKASREPACSWRQQRWEPAALNNSQFCWFTVALPVSKSAAPGNWAQVPRGGKPRLRLERVDGRDAHPQQVPLFTEKVRKVQASHW